MTTTEPSLDGSVAGIDLHEASHDNVSDWIYVKVALVLGVMTGLEVFMHFESVHRLSDTMITMILVVLMVLKFGLVAAYFMHLKYDNAWFTKMLGAGLVVAYPVYMVMAYAMGFLPGWSWFSKVALIAVPTIVAAIFLLWSWKGGDGDPVDHHPDDAHAGDHPAGDAEAVTEATH